MKLLFAHYRVGQTDGVSLEMDKWRRVLESMGHTCLYLAGNPSPVTDFVIDGMYYLGEENRAIVDNAYRGACTMDEAELRGRIYAAADEIAQRLIRIVRDNDIDVVIPNNIWSLGWHLPCAVAFTTAAEALPDVRFIGHNHDFYWERTLYSSPAYPFVREILATCCPPAGKNVRHAVINRIAQEELRRRRGIEATVVPNVYDFEARPWEKDAYNADLRARYGDLVIYNPGDVHRESSYENEEFGILFVTLRPVGQAPARIVPDGMPQILPTGTSAVKVENFFTELIDTLENKSAAMTDLPIYFAGFLLHMIGEIGGREDPTDNLEQRCAALKRILDRDFCRIRSLDDVRHNPYVSRYYFYKRFKELYGCSPLVYLRRKKLTYAAELLAGTDLRIIEIANTVGFDNEYYFSRLFAKETGMSASEYRRQKQGGDPAGKEPE